MEVTLLRLLDKKTYVDAFRKGQIRMMSAGYYNITHIDFISDIKSFVDFERIKKEGTRDEFEGMKFIAHPDKGQKTYSFTNGSIKVNATYTDFCGFSTPDTYLNTKISCFYALFLPSERVLLRDIVDRRITDFKEYFVIITNYQEFENRIKIKLESLGFAYRMGLVQYEYDDRYTGPVISSSKYSGDTWEIEWRIIAQIKHEDPYFLSIGDISDITFWGTTDDLIKGSIDSSKIYIDRLKK